MSISKECEKAPLRVKVEGDPVEKKGREDNEDTGENVVEEHGKIRRVVLLEIGCMFLKLGHTICDS